MARISADVIETDTFDAFDRTLRAAGPEAAIDPLIRHLADRGQFRALFDTLLRKARHELGLPLIQVGSLADLPESVCARFEERYVEAIRSVGQRFLDVGDIPGAWPDFRAIAEPEPVARAIDAYTPAGGDERLGQVLEVAFNHGANPRKGFEPILDHYGTCSAISVFEHLPPDESVRAASAGKLVRQLHEHLVANLRAEIVWRGQPLTPEGVPVAAPLEGRDWPFADDASHLDISHLAAVIRIAPLLTDPATIAPAVELTEYGAKLSPRHRYEGEPPFEDISKGSRPLPPRPDRAGRGHGDRPLPRHARPPTRTMRRRTRRSRRRPWSACPYASRLDEAIDVTAEHLAGLPESALACSGVAQLCQRAGGPDRLARIARERGDLVNDTAAVLQTKMDDSPRNRPGPPGSASARGPLPGSPRPTGPATPPSRAPRASE